MAGTDRRGKTPIMKDIQMGNSLKIARIWGVDIQVHWSFILILFYGAFLFSHNASNLAAGAIYGVVVILLLFVCVVLHEFGHAIMAKYFGVNVPHITLLPIGGVAQLERMPRKPMQEFLIAIAGPAVNFALAAVLLPAALLVVSLSMRTGTMWALISALMRTAQSMSVGGLLLTLAGTNLLLGIFNLLPAFPMDGGRILRALLALRLRYVAATRIAVLIGRGMAILFAIWGISGGGIFLLLVAFFVYVGGRGELEAVQSRYVLKDFSARQAVNKDAHVLYTSEPISRAVDYIMTTYQGDFPVHDLGNNLVGVLTRPRLVATLRGQGQDGRIVDVMIPRARVPVTSGDTTLADVWEQMLEAGSRVIIVQDQEQFLGLITLDDISELIQVMGAAKEREDTIAGGPGGHAEASPPEARSTLDIN
ncbi:MAG: site-2 protease family protein [Caldilineaceae bacterium SB0661_bin_32]|uniref:Zinc metalloprotease n=1 Tax=Caldilineaceae bacterium SB0661_bin_32 TaxID=2605255 RepID=A0A6B1DDT4_9CHLR|nr:site-2 protease family protein [Caldilineaceae bacterium SB0661_bin_32]